MKIEVFGAEGCKKCSNLKKKIEKVAEECDENVEVEKVTDVAKIASMGIMSTPAVAVDGEVEVAGKTLDEEEIEELID